MKTRMHQNQILHPALLLATLLGGMFMAPTLPAQPAVRQVDNRLLFVFDTSLEMKRRVPAVQAALKTMLATSTNNELRLNDSVGVWTFDNELHVGQFPLQRWQPDNAAVIATNINTFVARQKYSKKTRFDAFLPLLNQIVRNSERLTVVIFCDGDGEIYGTPYDSGVNQIFHQRQAERKKARLPIAVVLRSQLGKYVDCVVSFPPQPVTLPVFPPLPEPAPAPPKVVPAPPRPIVPPLIIIGTPATNRVPPPAAIPAPSAPTSLPPTPISATPNPPPPAVASTSAPAAASEVKPPDEASLTRAGAVPAQLKIDNSLLPRTNVVSPPAESSGIGRKGAWVLGVALLVIAGAVVMFRLGRAGR